MTIFDLLKECQDLAERCKKILDDSGWSYYEEIDSDLYDRSDRDQRFIAGMLYGVMDDLDTVCSSVEYLTREEVTVCRLSLASDGRPIALSSDYEFAYEYHCGYSIEYILPNPNYDSDDPDWDPCPEIWHKSRIEHNGDRYYILGDPDRDLEGLTVRVRQRLPF